MNKKPNVLFLFSDQHNAQCMSHRKHPHVKTPHLDRMVEEGISFTNAYCNNPICTPSRMSFLSGLYPSTHGYYGLYGHEPQESITSVIQYLKNHGYRTGALGKLHTPRYWIEKHCQYIYDEFIEYPKYLEGAGLYDRNDNRAFTGVRDGEASNIPYKHSCEQVLARQALRFVDNHGEPKDRGDEDSPWFAWVSFSRPHQPYTPSEPFASMYPVDQLTLPPNGDDLREDLLGMRDKDVKTYLSAYLALVSQVDDSIGNIIDGLRVRGQLDNTIIIYSADHGDYAGEHGLIEKKGGISSRAITNIPFIIRMPHKKYAGLVVDDIIESVDFFPTLCQMLGIDIPNTVQGDSFYEALTGAQSPKKEYALTENPYRKALASKSWRYVFNIDGQEDELYHLKEDPWECRNLVNNSEYGDVLQEMRRQLIEKLVRARKPINVINGGWHNHAYDLDGRIDLTQCGNRNNYW